MLTHIIGCAMRVHISGLADEVIIRLPITDPEYRTAKLQISYRGKIKTQLRDVLDGEHFASKQRSLHFFNKLIIPRYGRPKAVLGLVRWFGRIEIPMLEANHASMECVNDDRSRRRSYD